MKRIGIVLGSSPGGGVFQYAQAVLDAVVRFPEDQFAVIAAFSDPVWLDYLPTERVKRIRLKDSFRSRALNRIWHTSRLPMSLWRRVATMLDPNAAALAREKCDLWVCPSHDSWAFRASVPTLGTIHDLMHIYEARFPEVSSEIEGREYHFRETCRWSRGVAVDSNVGKQQLTSAYDIAPERVFVLPYIAPKYIYDAAAGKSPAEPRDLPRKYFFYPANLWLHKNHSSLFAALDRLRSKYPDMRLVLAGSQKNGYEAAKQKVSALGLDELVVFLEYVPDEGMYELYTRARALLMPSFFGPTNIPQLEAFVAGCPVAASRVYGVPEQVGDAALLFDPTSVDEIAGCMERLWTDDALCARLIENGRRKAAAWGPVQFTQRLQSIVETLIDGPPVMSKDVKRVRRAEGELV